MPKAKKQTIEKMLTDRSVPAQMRMQMLRQLCMEEAPVAQEILDRILENASKASADEQYLAKTQELADTLQQLQQGPLRFATFDRLSDSEALGRRAEVILPDGGSAFCVVPDAKLMDALRCGDTVWLDAQAGAVLFHQPGPVALGEEAQLERRLPWGDVEVSMGEFGRFVCRPSARLCEQIESGEAEPGSTLVVCQRRKIAFQALPSQDGPGHMRFLSNAPVPDVIVERDVGAPPAFIEEICEHVQRELSDPDLGRLYRLRRSCTLLATGVPGSGKTLSIDALWRRLYEIMSEFTGVPIEDLPQRVLQLRASEVLSKWVGGSDRAIARFFDEVARVAGETFEAPDGSARELPVLVICEEIDALARQRGDDSIHDRIQTTLLTRLDPAQSLFRDRLVIVICTSNVPSVLDVAFVRRAGGTVCNFGRVDRFGFRAVVEKHLNALPFRMPDASARRSVADLTAWLFAPNGSDPGQVELTFVGQPNPVVKYRRDFLTGGLIDRAVKQAAGEACGAQWHGDENPGLSSGHLMRAFDAQVRSIVDQLTPGNCEHYLTLPDATRVGAVRRVAQPPVLPIELERAS
jgi:ATP-dependent 26S proteasome regulatory subunit